MKLKKYLIEKANKLKYKTKKDATGHVHDVTLVNVKGDGSTVSIEGKSKHDHMHKVVAGVVQPAHKHTHNLETLKEAIKIDVKVGDTILGGKFKNKKITVKSIEYNERNEPLINGKPLMKYRLIPKLDEVAYGGNLGAEEMVKYYQVANKKQSDEMDSALRTNNLRKVLALFKSVLNVRLKPMNKRRRQFRPYDQDDQY